MMNQILEVNTGYKNFWVWLNQKLFKELHAHESQILLLSFLYPYIHFPVDSVDTVVKPELQLNVDDVVLSEVSDVLDPWIPVGFVTGL